MTSIDHKALQNITSPARTLQFHGWIFDVYIVEDTIHLWLLDADGRCQLFVDRHQPTIFACGSPAYLKALVRRLVALNALACEPVYETRRLFYHNKEVPALALRIARPSILPRIKHKLHRFYRKMDIYHADIDPVTDYLQLHSIHPLAEVQIQAHFNSKQQWNILSIQPVEQDHVFDYKLPEFSSLALRLSGNHRQKPGPDNLVLIEKNESQLAALDVSTAAGIVELNHIIQSEDPDIIFSIFGDAAILPEIFRLAQEQGIALKLDRDPIYTARRIKRKGSSFQTYGNWIYSAPAYPLFGRWHIDHANSFVYKETELSGILELARLSCMNVQRLARASTGNALTAIETRVAITQGYLVPWQKSAVEEPKTAYELLIADKGGLVFMPDGRPGRVWQHVAQIDFSQMYPTIMVNHNISPETVRCICCREEALALQRPLVPELGYHICTRRRGVVTQALDGILKRRAYYKKCKKNKALSAEQRENYDRRQNSLKWMLVTAFGYLGYRNAKFGRIESHESVTAFGRQKLLKAKTIAEERGLRVLHGITDCLFIQGSLSLSENRLDSLCQQISAATGIEMNSDGIYAWLVFLPARRDPLMPVANRYLGLFRSGEMKYRGIAARRKDTPVMISAFQREVLAFMQAWQDPDQLARQHQEVVKVYKKYDTMLLGDSGFDWKDLLLRRTVGREPGNYQAQGATASTLDELMELGHAIMPGEKVRYLVVNQKHRDPTRRYRSEEKLAMQVGPIRYDRDYYRRLLFEAFREVWEYFAPTNYFETLPGENLRLDGL